MLSTKANRKKTRDPILKIFEKNIINFLGLPSCMKIQYSHLSKSSVISLKSIDAYQKESFIFKLSFLPKTIKLDFSSSKTLHENFDPIYEMNSIKAKNEKMSSTFQRNMENVYRSENIEFRNVKINEEDGSGQKERSSICIKITENYSKNEDFIKNIKLVALQSQIELNEEKPLKTKDAVFLKNTICSHLTIEPCESVLGIKEWEEVKELFVFDEEGFLLKSSKELMTMMYKI